MTEEQKKVIEECYERLASVDLNGCVIAIPVGTPRPPKP
jgi:hypothetical protein